MILKASEGKMLGASELIISLEADTGFIQYY